MSTSPLSWSKNKTLSTPANKSKGANSAGRGSRHWLLAQLSPSAAKCSAILPADPQPSVEHGSHATTVAPGTTRTPWGTSIAWDLATLNPSTVASAATPVTWATTESLWEADLRVPIPSPPSRSGVTGKIWSESSATSKDCLVQFYCCFLAPLSVKQND